MIAFIMFAAVPVAAGVHVDENTKFWQEFGCQARDQDACLELQEAGHDVMSLLQHQMQLSSAALEESAPETGNSEINSLVQAAIGMVKEKGGKVTPEVQKFLKTVLKEIEDALVPISSAHKSDVTRLEALYKAILAAITELGKATKVSDTFEKLVAGLRSALSTCRKEESAIFKQLGAAAVPADASLLSMENFQEKASDCLGELKKLKAIMEGKSDAVAATLKEMRSYFTSDPSVAEMLSPAVRKKALSWAIIFAPQNKELDIAIDIYEKKKKACNELAKKLKAKKKECDAAQSKFEVETCKYANGIQRMCKTFHRDYMDGVTSFDAEKARVRGMESDRKAEYVGLKHAHCFLKAIMGGKLTAENVEKCKAIKFPTDDLNVNYKETPKKPKCKAMPPIPCSKAFLTGEYSSMPTGTSPATCEKCILPVR